MKVENRNYEKFAGTIEWLGYLFGGVIFVVFVLSGKIYGDVISDGFHSPGILFAIIGGIIGVIIGLFTIIIFRYLAYLLFALNDIVENTKQPSLESSQVTKNTQTRAKQQRTVQQQNLQQSDYSTSNIFYDPSNFYDPNNQ